MGSDLIQYNPRNRAYILGAIDTARIVDLNGKYICEWSEDHDQTDDEIVLIVIDHIKKHPLTQEQPASFAVLNAYHQSYCLNPPRQ